MRLVLEAKVVQLQHEMIWTRNQNSVSFYTDSEPSPESRQYGGFTFVQGGLDIKTWQKFHWFI